MFIELFCKQVTSVLSIMSTVFEQKKKVMSTVIKCRQSCLKIFKASWIFNFAAFGTCMCATFQSDDTITKWLQ